MGNTTSSSKFEKITSKDLDISQNEFLDLSSSCSSSGQARNVVNIVGSRGVNLNASQQNEITNLCVLKNFISSDRNSSIVDTTIDKLEKELKASGGFPASSTESEQRFKDNLKLKLGQDSYNQVRKECITNIDADNVLEIIDSQNINANINQVNKAYLECLQEIAKKNNIDSNFESQTSLESSDKQSSQGFDPIKSVGEAVSNIFSSNPILLIAAALVLILLLMK